MPTPDPDEWPNLSVCGPSFTDDKGLVTSQTFTYKLAGEVTIAIDESGVALTLTIPGRESESHIIPLSLFNNETQVNSFQSLVSEAFCSKLHSFLEEFAAYHFANSIQYSLVKSGLTPLNLRRLVGIYGQFAGVLLQSFFGVPSAGRQRAWNTISLTFAVLDALSTIKPAKGWTYNHIAEVLKKEYPGRAPKSGDSLRKLCGALGVDVRVMKRELKQKLKSQTNRKELRGDKFR